MRKWQFLLLALFTTMLVGLSSLVYAHPSERDGLEAPKFDFGLIGDLPYTSEQDANFFWLISLITAI
jgi:hypothetical protein